jgi:hyperosmotically inducible periplasmic protein
VSTKKAACFVFLALIVGAPLSSLAQGGNSTAASNPASNKSADRALQKRVRAVLAKDKELNAANITVRARAGAVTLEGSVTSQDEVLRAEQVAKGVSGVNSVKNALTLRHAGQ